MKAKKKILLLSDDLRMHSGVATMSRELVMGCLHKYDFVNLGGAQKHPEKGKVFDLSEAANKERGLTDAYCKVYCVDGYGNPEILKQVMNIEKPDAILHFTDPRFWGWLYQMEREIRQKIPLTYYNIWDSIPYPMWNRPFYKSCDALFSISKQTFNINKQVLGEDFWIEAKDVKSSDDCKDKSILHYVPHGINEDVFKPVENDKVLQEFRKKVFKGKEYDFVLFYNNRNIQRKRLSDIILAYRTFCDNLDAKEAEKCCLLLHTAPVDRAGTDLFAVKEALCPDYDILFSTNKHSPQEMNLLYNLSDVVVNIASNEGFGLSHAEALLTGRCLINNITGGLQDGCGFRDEDGNLIEFTKEWGSNHDGRYKKCGNWVKPVFPATRMIQGSVPTPYIFDDHAKWEDVAEAMMAWYLTPKETRKKFGEEGRQFALGEGGLNAKNMCEQLIFGMETTLNNFNKRSKFSLHTADEFQGNTMFDSPGFEIPKIDKEKIKETL